MPKTATKPAPVKSDESPRAALIAKIEAGEAARRRQSQIIAELEQKLGPLSVTFLARLRAGLTMDGTQRQTDPFVIERTDEYSVLEDVIHDGMTAAQDLQENPPGWLLDRRRELLRSIADHDAAVARANRELRWLNDQVMELEPQQFSGDV
jgi:hypothetical protein